MTTAVCGRMVGLPAVAFRVESGQIPPSPRAALFLLATSGLFETMLESGLSSERYGVMIERVPEANLRRLRNDDPEWAIHWYERWISSHAWLAGENGFQGWVYFVQARSRDPIKIGYAGSNVKQRVQDLQVGSPYKLNVLCTIRGNRNVEGFLHQTFEHWRLSGEWFKANAFGLCELIEHLEMRLPV